MYVGKARRNTDLNNAKVMEDTVYNMLANYVANALVDDLKIDFEVHWKKEITSSDLENLIKGQPKDSVGFSAYKLMKIVFPNGVPECHTGVFQLCIVCGTDDFDHQRFGAKCRIIDEIKDYEPCFDFSYVGEIDSGAAKDLLLSDYYNKKGIMGFAGTVDESVFNYL